jgi:plastocyanin
MSKHVAALLSAAGLAVAIAACGSSSSSSAAAAGRATSQQLAVAASPNGSLAFTKNRLTAKAGTITIAFTNNSPLPHNLTVQKGTNGANLGATPTFQGATKMLTVKLAPGTYTFYCSVPGHRAGGMQGTLTVS